MAVELDGDDASEAALGALHPDEAAHARALPSAHRRLTWVGGRLALRAALADLGAGPAAAEPLLATERGAPRLPAGWLGSISHKPRCAVALAARDAGPHAGAKLGIDLEIDRALRAGVERHLLTEGERRRLEALPVAERAAALMRAFAAKEAIYKALDPWVGRYVAFGEAEIDRDAAGAPVASLRLRAGEGPFAVELHEEPVPGMVLVAARIRSQGA